MENLSLSLYIYIFMVPLIQINIICYVIRSNMKSVTTIKRRQLIPLKMLLTPKIYRQMCWQNSKQYPRYCYTLSHLVNPYGPIKRYQKWKSLLY